MTLVARIGGWLFRQRSWLPLPLAAGLLFVPPDSQSVSMWASGALIVACGEAIRLWAVHHIGAISRTRSDRLGPLIASGPFARVRNPLYLGNILLWTGFAVSASLAWLAPIVVLLLALEYHAIVRWEEGLLAQRIGEPYARYVAQVPRWLPSLTTASTRTPSTTLTLTTFSWRDTLFSERGTLIAIGVGFLLLWLKARF